MRNNYSEVSDICYKYNEPVFIIRNGEGDLAVMSIEAYEKLSGRKELYEAIDSGLSNILLRKIILNVNLSVDKDITKEVLVYFAQRDAVQRQ